MYSIHRKFITNDCWISSAIILIFLCVLGGMLCYGDRIMNGQLVMDMTDP